MYKLTESQAFWPSLSFLVFFVVFVVAAVRSFRLRREDTDKWSKMILDAQDAEQNDKI